MKNKIEKLFHLIMNDELNFNDFWKKFTKKEKKEYINLLKGERQDLINMISFLDKTIEEVKLLSNSEENILKLNNLIGRYSPDENINNILDECG
ncbi:MAG: hypothetical protein AABY32_00780 [Nanoarchaeota archaeon]